MATSAFKLQLFFVADWPYGPTWFILRPGGDDINYIDQKTEFTDDIFVYGDTYASSFNNVEISVVGSTLTFTVAGIGSTSLTLS